MATAVNPQITDAVTTGTTTKKKSGSARKTTGVARKGSKSTAKK